MVPNQKQHISVLLIATKQSKIHIAKQAMQTAYLQVNQKHCPHQKKES